MFDFSSINSAKNKAKNNYDKFDISFEKEYNEAVEMYTKFQKTQDKTTLYNAAQKISQCLKYKKDKVEPYFFLCYTFFILGKTNLSIKYLKEAKKINDKFDPIIQIEKLIFKSI